MSTFGDIRARLASVLEYGVFEDVEMKDEAGLIDYLKGLKTEPRPNTTFKVAGRTIPRPEIEKLIGKAGITFGDDKSETTLDDKQLKKMGDYSEKMSAEFDKIAFEGEDEEVFKAGFDKLMKGGKISKEDAEIVAKYAKIGETESGKKLKVYFANTTPGEFRQGAREKVLDVTDSDGSLQKALMDAGMESTPSTTVGGGVKPKIGPKAINPNKIIGKKRKVEVQSEKTADGKIKSVTVDGKKMNRIEPPDEKALNENTLQLEAVKKQNPDLTDKQVDALVQRTRRAIQRHNESLENLANLKDVEFLDPVEGLEGLNQKERGDKIQKEYSMVIHGKLKELMGDNPTKAEQDILADIEKMSTIESQEDFDNAVIETLRKMDKVDSIRKGSADLAESFVYMSLNKKGLRTELPAGENFPVADVISLGGDIDMNELDPNDPEYASKIAMQGLPLVVNLEMEGGISVKKDGGAASAAKSKLGESTFKNEKTAEQLYKLVDNHNAFLGTQSEPTTDETIKEGTKQMDEVANWAIDNGVLTKEEVDGLNYGGRSPKEWAKDTLDKWEDEGKGPFAAATLKGLEMHAKQALLLSAIHNSELTEQSYGNVNVSTKKSDGGIHVTDGITSASLMGTSLNPGFKFVKDKDGNTIPRPNAVYTANLKHAEWDAESERFTTK
jgi:hypothetical protein